MYFYPIPRQKPHCKISDFITFLKMFFNGTLIRGNYINKFESEFAKKISINHVLTMNSCRAGFSLIIDTLGIKQGDEVILPVYNLSVFPKILMLKGIKPVFVDINKETLTIDVKKIKNSVTNRTKAIIAVHLFGNTCDMKSILKIAKACNLYIIEDCANAHGTKYNDKNVGTYGDASCFSFGHSKDIPTFSGGAICTNNDVFFNKLRTRYEEEFVWPKISSMFKLFIKNVILKIATLKIVFLFFVYPLMFCFSVFKIDIVDHFIEENDQPILSINNSRFTNFQSKIGLKKLSEDNLMQEKRVALARKLNNSLSSLKKVDTIKLIHGGNHAYWNYPILFDRREELIKMLFSHGIDARSIESYDCNKYEIFKEFKVDCPVNDEISKKIIGIPLYHYMKEAEIAFISKQLTSSITKLNTN